VKTPITQPLLKYAGRLRFPKLLALTAVLFAVNLFVPDMLPFADEIVLGLVALLLSSWKKGRGAPAADLEGGGDGSPPPGPG
jgi:hypothetical protein